MVDFIRVRAAEGPLHEYDAPLLEVERNPELYVVLDDEPVTAPRAPKYVVPEARPTPKKASPKSSVGDPTEGEG